MDPHVHLRDGPPGHASYRLADLAADVALSGHRVEAGVFVECGTMYDADAPMERRSLGETLYIRAAAEGAAGTLGKALLSAMVGRVDLTLGERVKELLELHRKVSGGRLRGIRNSIAWDAAPPFDAMGPDPDLFDRPGFRDGMAALARAGLLFETWLLGGQIPRLTALARACPDNVIVLDHLGCPLGVGPYAGRMAEVFDRWSNDMRDLAECPNVVVKLGGLGPFWERAEGPQAGSIELAAQWAPWIERAVALFGAGRCMFESNFPANVGVASYGRTWNAFKIVTGGWSAAERTALFAGTARRLYL